MKTTFRKLFIAAALCMSASAIAAPDLSLGPLKIGDSGEGVEATLAQLNSEYEIFPIEAYSDDEVLGYMGEHIVEEDGKRKLKDAVFVRIEEGKIVGIARKWTVDSEDAVIPKEAYNSFLEKFGATYSQDGSFLNSTTPSVQLVWFYRRDGKVEKSTLLPECGGNLGESTFRGRMAKFSMPSRFQPKCQSFIGARARNGDYQDQTSKGLVKEFEVLIVDLASQYDTAVAAEERRKAEAEAERAKITEKAKGNKLAL